MRGVLFIFLIVCLLFPGVISQADEQEIALIIEIDSTPSKAERQIKNNYPFIEVVATYDTLFQGIAIKGKARHIEKVTQAEFVQAVYPVQSYEAIRLESPIQQGEGYQNIAFPHSINPTSYTGKGVKVAVIDTGIDNTHPDLAKNVRGGYDLVDLDDEAQETTEEEGMPTYHGTHVAGIIAANGELKGVAPDSDLYAYRALGPGGYGTSIQVIAAMEEAVKEGADVMNLSLGNSVNGPDYPTSKAVNEAAKQGVAVVIANGNTGPENWTVGAPATASTAMSVGAYQNDMEQTLLLEPKSETEIPLKVLQTGVLWDLERDMMLTEDASESKGKIGMIAVGEMDLTKKMQEFQDEGAEGLLLEIEDANEGWMNYLAEASLHIPVAIIEKKDYLLIQKQIKEEKVYFKCIAKKQTATIAPFSSLGPVTVNWMMKPDIIAPGVNVLSTVPGGYDILNGTSMATPHIAGAVAVLKEAHPNWTNEQIFGALKTTAKKVEAVEPVAQGAGNVQLEKALNTDVIIDNPLLSFGKTAEHINNRELTLSIENLSKSEKKFHFTIPKREKGLTWELPKTFFVGPGETKEVPISLKVNAMQVRDDILQGWIDLETEGSTFSLPYIAVQKEADYPRVTGFTFQLDEQDEESYAYELYAAEQVESVEVLLYDLDTLTYEGRIGPLEDIEIGMNEGQIKSSDIEQKGYYYGLIVVRDKQGEYFNYETEVLIE